MTTRLSRPESRAGELFRDVAFEREPTQSGLTGERNCRSSVLVKLESS